MEFAHVVHRPSAPSATVPPAPWVPAVLCCGPAAATFGFGFAAGLAGSTLLVAPISIVLFGAYLAALRFVHRARLRAAADEWIAVGVDGPATRYRWRIEELTSPRERSLLASSLRSVVRELNVPHRHVGSLLNRRTLRPQRALLTEIAERLADGERPVSPSGVVRGAAAPDATRIALSTRMPALTVRRATPAPSSARSSTAWRCVADV